MNGSQGSTFQQSQRIPSLERSPEDGLRKKGIKERWKLFNETILMALYASCFMLEQRQVAQ